MDKSKSSEEKEVCRLRSAKYYKENLEKRKEVMRNYVSKNKDKVNKSKHSWEIRNPEKHILSKAVFNARIRGLEFSITIEDIIIPKYCPYLGIELTNIKGQGRCHSNISIDRIDNTKGYVKGNVQIISDLANKMKQSATPDQLVAFAKGVLKLYGRPIST